MQVTTRRLAIAGVLAAAAVTVPAAALAGNNTTSNDPATAAHSSAAAGAAKPSPPAGPTQSEVATRLASRLGISKSAAEHALERLQRNVSRAQLAAIAHDLGVTPAQLDAALRDVKLSFAPPGTSAKPSIAHQKSAPQGRSLTSLPAAASALASRLGVSVTAAQHAMNQIGVLSAREGGIEPDSPQLAAIAHQLGVSPSQLNSALRSVKESFAGPR
jgi:hypothetical protein